MSAIRLATLRLRYPGLKTIGRVHIAAACDIQVATGATLTIDSCHITRGVTIIAGKGSTLSIAADYIGPNSTIVARESITIGQGTKIAENVVIRDGNHDHAYPLRSMKFTAEPIVVGEDVWFGASSILLSGVNVGAGSTVAAGAVVTSDVAPNSVVGGVPARVIGRTRD